MPMPKIKWVGFQKWDKGYPEIPLPEDATEITSPDHYFLASLKYGIIPMLVCFAALFGKRMLYGEFPLDRRFLIIGIVIGILLIPVHELLHSVCFPRGSTVYVGLSPEKLAAFAVCHTPITKKRFIVMSLMPVILWLVPFALFLLFPISWKIPAALSWPAAMIGAVSPSPDYMDVHRFCKCVPNRAYIQSSNSGWYWFTK